MHIYENYAKLTKINNEETMCYKTILIENYKFKLNLFMEWLMI